MKYQIVQIPQQQEFVQVQGPDGPVTRKNINPAVEYPAGLVQCLYSERSGLYGVDPGKRVELWESTLGTATDNEIFSACPGLRDFVALRIRALVNETLLAIATPYQPAERETWPIQVTEAERWLADATAETPMIDAICAGRNISKAVLIGYIMDNTTAFRAASGMILGQQQALLERIYSVTTVAELLAVKWA
jgi:hypothetical protein